MYSTENASQCSIRDKIDYNDYTGDWEAFYFVEDTAVTSFSFSVLGKKGGDTLTVFVLFLLHRFFFVP